MICEEKMESQIKCYFFYYNIGVFYKSITPLIHYFVLLQQQKRLKIILNSSTEEMIAVFAKRDKVTPKVEK